MRRTKRALDKAHATITLENQADQAALLSWRRAVLQAARPELVEELSTLSIAELIDAMSPKGGFPPRATAALVLAVFASRALKIDETTNCLTTTLFASAIEHVRALGPPSESMPLYGIPFSVKDHLHVAGAMSTAGLAKLVGIRQTDDLPVIKLLRRAGAIPFVKSNVPQTLLSWECGNPVFGTTSNPHNPQFTSGGSSGGEAALIGGGASILGLGSDAGGSLRMPAHMCGCAAFKATSHRVPTAGSFTGIKGQTAVPVVLGPMARNVDDLIRAARVLMGDIALAEAPDRIPIPFNESKFATSRSALKIGYFTDIGVVSCAPPCVEAVEASVRALRDAGHTVTEFRIPDVWEGILAFYALLSADGSIGVHELLEDEKVSEFAKPLLSLNRAAKWKRNLAARALRLRKSTQLLGDIVDVLGEKSVAVCWSWQQKQADFRKRFLDAWTAQGDFDVVLCPVFPTPAPRLGSFSDRSFMAMYSILFSLLDFPAGVVPVDVAQGQRWTAPSKAAGASPEELAREHVLQQRVRAVYEPQAMVGLPVGVQVVGKPYEDETVLATMKQLEEHLDFAPKPCIAGTLRSLVRKDAFGTVDTWQAWNGAQSMAARSGAPRQSLAAFLGEADRKVSGAAAGAPTAVPSTPEVAGALGE